MKKLIKCKNGIIKEMTLDNVVVEFEKMTHTKDVLRWMSYYEKDDLIQMAYIGLIKAYEYYDISQNKSFVDYSKKVIQDVIAHTYKKDKRQKRGGEIEFCSIYSNINDTDNIQLIDTIKDENVDCEKSAITQIENQEVINLINSLPIKDQELIDLYFSKGLNYAEIGRMYNKTRECIRIRIKNLTNKLKIRLEVAV